LERRHFRAACGGFLRMPFLETSGTRRNGNLATPNGWRTSLWTRRTTQRRFLTGTRKSSRCNEPRRISCFPEQSREFLRHNEELVEEVAEKWCTLATRHTYGNVAARWALDPFQREGESVVSGEAKRRWLRSNSKVFH
jgi:hypothetical protein